MNLVEITVRSDTAQATRAIDEIKVKLADLGTKVAEARVKLAGDDKALLQLSRINARIIELSNKIADPKISLEGVARAQTELLALIATLDKLNSTSGSTKFTFGQGSTGFFGAIQKGLAAILNLGPASIPVLGAIGLAILAIVTYLGSLITELAAAGIGLTAFGALALPTFMKIIAGVQAVSGAVGKVATDKAWDAIPKALQPAVKAALALKNVFDQVVKAMQPTAVKVFGDALKVVGDLLPQLLPLAISVGKAIDGLLKGFDGFVKSAGFKDFMSQMSALSGPAVTAIGKGLGQVAIALGNLITAGSGPAGLSLLVGTFRLLAGAINLIAGAVRTSQRLIFAFMSGIQNAVISVMGTVKALTDMFLTMVSAALRFASHLPGAGFLKGIADAADRAKVSADNAFAGIVAGAQAMKAKIAATPIIYKLQSEISGLLNGVAAARAAIKTVPKSQQVALRADASQLLQQAAAAAFALSLIQSKTVYVNMITIPGTMPKATGGITGAAGGGGRSGMTLVGEHGAELVSLPPGSMVHSNPDTQRMLSQGGGSVDITVSVDPRMAPGLSRELLKWLKFQVRTTGGGDVQAAFGSG